MRIVERPGRWMDVGSQARLLEDLRDVVRRSIESGALDYGVLAGTPERWEHAILTILYAPEDGRPVAFNAPSWMPCVLRGRRTDVLHLGLVMIEPGFRARGLSAVLYGLTCFLLFARRAMRPIWISNVTQVPAIVGMFGESFEDVFPVPDERARRSFDHLALAREIMTKHRAVFGVGADAGFDERRFVITNAYTGGSDNLKKTFEQAPKHRNEIFNGYCQRMLDYSRGDDLLQLGQFNHRAALNYFVRSADGLSARFLLKRFLSLTAGGMLLPALHWFSASRPTGELRAWR